jgi:osmotically-inducible protein OsmY
MSYLVRSLPTITLTVLVALMFGHVRQADAGQVQAIKDGWLVMKVHSEFLDESVLDGSNIDVDVKDGVVTLQGTVPTAAARARALELARKNDGVKNVVDQLKIGPASSTSMEDKVDRAGQKAERAGEKAADKAASTTQKTGRAVNDGWIKSKIYAQYMRHRRRRRTRQGHAQRHREVDGSKDEGRLDREGDRRREERARQSQGRRRSLSGASCGRADDFCRTLFSVSRLYGFCAPPR